ncbi:hypothetical protein Golomagni_04351 [Golovinomyces magnicellulatus]|nr:hypothetical protein Golomagni_04351 [Golovinomyces magnicellulatus]
MKSSLVCVAPQDIISDIISTGFGDGNPKIRPRKTYHQFNTRTGDLMRLRLFLFVVKDIGSLDPIKNMATVGDYFYQGLVNLARQYPAKIMNSRGRDFFNRKSRNVTMNTGESRERAINQRSLLIFQKHHADISLASMKDVVKL